MVLTLLSLFAIQLEPRFTMSAGPGDRFVAEVFRFPDGVTSASVDSLIGEAHRSLDRIEDLPEGGRIRMVMGAAGSGDRIMVMAPVADGPDQPDNVCRISERRDGAVDNGQRALSWCLTFMGGPGLTVDLPPPPPPR